jgi:glutathione S-transferase
MAIVLYAGSGSPYSWRVALSLTLKGLEHETRVLEFSRGETRTPEFRALNPRGKVPVLVDGDTVVHESLAILGYLDAAYPAIRLSGQSPRDVARIWCVVSEVESYLAPATRDLTTPLYKGAVDDLDRLREVSATVHGELRRLDDRLAASAFLAGPHPTLADVYAYPTVHTILRGAGKPVAAELDLGFLPLSQRHGPVAGWLSRMAALPGVDATYPPHWRTSP